MDYNKVTRTILPPEESHCRSNFIRHKREDEQDVLFWKCDTCGKFTSLNNASDVGNMRDTRCRAEECSISHTDEPVPGPSGSDRIEQNDLQWESRVPLHAPKSSLPRESSTEAQESDLTRKQNVRFSNFGDQCNLRYPAGNKLNRCCNYRTPFRAHLANIHYSRHTRAPTFHAYAPSRRFFNSSKTKPHLAAHRNGARMQHLNETVLPGYPSLYFQRLSNASQEIQPPGSIQQIDTEFAEPEHFSDSFVPTEKCQETEPEPHSEHHCSTGYGESQWNYPEVHVSSISGRGIYAGALRDSKPYRVSTPGGTFSYRVPRNANHTPFAHESMRYSPGLTPQGSYHDTHVPATQAYSRWCEGCDRPVPPLPQPPCYTHEGSVDEDQKDFCSARVCVDCKTERDEFMKIRPCCCIRHCTRHYTIPKRRYASVNRMTS